MSNENPVRRIISNHFGLKRDQVSQSDKLIEDLSCDCLDRTEILISIERAFDIKIDDNQFSKLETVKQVIDLVDSLVIEF